MKLEVPSFGNGDPIPGRLALCVPADEGHVALGENRSPHLRWSETPEGTRSLAIVMHDPEVPSVGDDVNVGGRTVPHDLPRVDFYHWVLVDVSPTVTELPEGVDSDGVAARGKEPGRTDHGVRGLNGYTAWFAGDGQMEGTYGGYDGPCPPWNDERLHNYYIDCDDVSRPFRLGSDPLHCWLRCLRLDLSTRSGMAHTVPTASSSSDLIGAWPQPHRSLVRSPGRHPNF